MIISTRSALLVLLLATILLPVAHKAFAQAQPSIIAHPQSQSGIVGTNVAFTVTASGQSPLTYQWYFNGSPLTDSTHISGSSSNTIYIVGVVTNDAGNYSVTVSNRHAVVTSSPAILTVLVPVTITSQPTNQTVVSGTNTTFSVTADGTGPITYQWIFNGAPLADGGRFAGGQTTTLIISGVLTNDAGNYFVTVSNRHGVATSSNATLTVLVPVSLSSEATNRTVVQGSNTTLSVMAEGTSPLAFQWFFNGLAISDGGRVVGSQTAVLSVTGVLTNDAGNYSVAVSNVVNSIVSSNAVLSVSLPTPSIPFISGVSPGFGPPGTSVTISGGNFSSTASNNIVWFGAVAAPVLAATSSEISVVVPTGASQAPITLAVDGLVCASANPFVVTYIGSGTFSTSSFAIATNLPASGTPVGIRIVDLDGDGKADLLVANNTENTISVYRNISTNGALTLGSFAPRINFAVGASPRQFAIGDIDGDGKRDVVVAHNGGSTVSVFRNISTPGAFTAGSFGARVDFATGANPHQLALVDLNGDGKLDLAIGNSVGNTLSILRNTATSGNITATSFAAKVDFPASSGSGGLAVGDIDGDGKPDVVLSNSGANSISLFRNTTPVGNAGINFAAKVDFSTPANPFGVLSIGDLDGDSKLDIAVAAYSGGTVSVFRNISTVGTIIPGSLDPRVDLVTGGSTHAVLVADIDGDAKSDLIAVSEYANTVAVFRNVSTNGMLVVGSFAPRVDFATASNPGGVAVGDLDGDGRPDVVAAASYGNVLSVFRNLNIPIPPTAPAITSQPTNQTVVVGANGSLRVVATGTQPFTYQWFFNDTSITNGGSISGATTDTLAVTSVQTNNTGNYFVVITNSIGSVTSAVVILNIGVPPSITLSPVSQTNVVSSNTTFTVIADGTAPLNFQWRFNGINLLDNARIGGATNSGLTILNLATTDAGNYDVVVINPAGSVTSVVAVLTLLQRPTFTSQPVGRSIVLGLPTIFSASVVGTAPLSYQWQFEGVDISGATNTIYSISSVAATNLGTYRLVASNAVGVTTSADAPLTFGKIVAWGRNDFGQTVVPASLTNVAMLAAGGVGANPGHNLALRTDGSVVGWGYNGFGQTTAPVGLSNVISIAAGGTHSMALRSDGKVFAWGNNGNGQTNVPNLSNIVAIAAGGTHSMALRSDGKIFAWGTVVNVDLFTANLTAIACGQTHSLAIRNDGSLLTWGNSSWEITNPPTGVNELVGIAGGQQHSLVLRSNGTVIAWGYSGNGQTNVPLNLTNAMMVTAGDNYSAALRSNGTALVWGINNYGQTNIPAVATNLVSIAGGGSHVLALIGDDAPLIIQQPIGGVNFIGREAILRGKAVGASPLNYQWQFNGVDIPNATNATLNFANLAATDAGDYRLVVSNAVGVATSVSAPLMILNNGLLTILVQPPGTQTNFQGSKVTLNFSIAGNGPLKFQWRFNGANISGATNQNFIFDPVLFAKAGNYSAIISNQFGSVTSGTLTQQVQMIRTWGYVDYYKSSPPIVTNVVSVAVGTAHFLALRSDGKIEGWGSSGPAGGSGYYGETGTPAALSNATIIAIAAGYSSSLALRSDGTPFAWGYSYYGQTNVPASATNVTAIASGPYHSLALRSDGTAVAWGQNSYGNTIVPVAATNLIAIVAGQYHSLGLRANGTMISWGNGAYGLSVIPLNATNIIAIAAGALHNLALRTDGTVITWGDNSRGQTNTPAGLSNVVAISASGGHSSALRSDGTIVNWGPYLYSNTSGNVVAPSDLNNFIQIADGGDRSIGILGTRAPAITIQPFSRYIFKGSNTLLVAKAVGAQPVGYQWLFNGANIPGATNDFIALTNVQFSNAGYYQLVVSNSYGVAVSKGASLVVTLPLDDSLDTLKSLTWVSGGSAPWFGQSTTTHDGVDAARSGTIGNSQSSVLQTTYYTTGAQISFWWKISSETGFDTLEFRLNGVVQAAISGEVDWEQRTFSIPSGANAQTLQWSYSKDSSSSFGQDAAWVDQVVLVPNPPVITVQPVGKTVDMGSNVLFNVTATGTGPLVFQWRKNATNTVGFNSSTLSLTNVGRAQSGTYSVIVTNAGGSVTSSNAILNVLVPQQLATPTISTDGTFQFSSTDADGGLLFAANLANFELQASADLITWMTLSNALNLTNGTLFLIDADRTNFPARYYRVIEH